MIRDIPRQPAIGIERIRERAGFEGKRDSRMGMTGRDERAMQPRKLVAIASYGTSNESYLQKLLHEYRSMPFDVDVVVISNIEKKLGLDVGCIAGLPTKNPWSLPFAYKALFAERRNRYDLFIYSEDNILITEKNIRAFLAVAV
jgi:hypothetical protein